MIIMLCDGTEYDVDDGFLAVSHWRIYIEEWLGYFGFFGRVRYLSCWSIYKNLCYKRFKCMNPRLSHMEWDDFNNCVFYGHSQSVRVVKCCLR